MGGLKHALLLCVKQALNYFQWAEKCPLAAGCGLAFSSGLPGPTELHVNASLDLVVGNGEPLHVSVMISTASTERRNVVDLVAWAGQAGAAGDRAGIRLDESVTLDGAAGLLG